MFIVTVLLASNHAVYAGTKKGLVCVINTDHIMEGQYDFETLPGTHHGKVESFVVLQGKINPQGFLSSCGVITKEEQTRPDSMYYARQLDSVPCTVLMSIGVGYQELFTSNMHEKTCFIMWAIPSM